VFERFTDRARYVVVLAQEEARWLNHNYIGTEHILLGLIHEADGVAAKALESLSISLEAVRRQVEEIVGQGEAAPTGHIPFTSRAKKVLEQSFREALQLGHNYIGTEHILLGLIREGEGVGPQILQKLGADMNRVRQTVIHQMPGMFGEEVPPAGSMPPKVLRSPSPFEEREKVVLSFLINEGLSTSELANLLGVSEEKVGEIIQALIEKLKAF
jgi:ATP-dependent Clp protease ATP-binding subunit ClpC